VDPLLSYSTLTMAARLALTQYVQETYTKLCVTGKIDEAELQSKVMPSVVESIQRLSSRAPADVKNQLETFLLQNSVLPMFAADKDAFKRTLKSIYQFLSTNQQSAAAPVQNQETQSQAKPPRSQKAPSTNHEASQAPATEEGEVSVLDQKSQEASLQSAKDPVENQETQKQSKAAKPQSKSAREERDVDLKPKEETHLSTQAPAKNQKTQIQAKPSKSKRRPSQKVEASPAPATQQGKAACDHESTYEVRDADLKIRTVPQANTTIAIEGDKLSDKEVSVMKGVSLHQEAASKTPATQDEDFLSVESKSTCEETDADGEVSVESKSTCEEIRMDLKHKDEMQVVKATVNEACNREAPLPKVTSSHQADHSSRGQLLSYIESTLSRLETNDSMSTMQFRTKVLPSVISSIERLSAAAPDAIRKGIKDIFQKSGVIPVWAAGLESLRQALNGIKSFIPECQGPVSAPKVENSLGNPLRGISVAYLSTVFLEQVKAFGFDRTAKVYEIEPSVIRGKGKDVICPRDGKPGASYIDCLSESDAGMSTHMLSYTWGYEIGDIVDGLLAFCKKSKLDVNKVFVWICCLCINQHRVIEARERGDVVPFEKFKAEFGHRVSSIGHIVALMSPWKDPSYTKRVWCDFEMYTAASLGEQACKVSVTMPPRESDDMRKTLMTGGAGNHELWEALQNVKIEEAQASVQADKERILQLIQDTIGFHALNSTVTKCLQSWVAATCMDIFDELSVDCTRSKEEIAKTAASVGYVLRDVGKNEKALTILTEAEELFIEAGILNTQDGAMLLSNLGATHRRCGDLDTGLKILIQGQQVFERTGTMETLEGAMMYNSLGAAKRKAHDFAGSFDAYEAAHTILRSIGMLETSEGAMLLNSYGALKREVGDLDGALKAFGDAETILEKVGKMYSPAGHVLMNSIAAAKKSRNDMQGSLQAYEYGKHILERIGTLETEHGMQILMNIGLAKKKMRDLPGAHEAYTLARSICQKINAMHTPEAAKLFNLMADLESQMASKGKGNTKGGSYGGGKQGNKGGRAEQDGDWRGGAGCKGKGKVNAQMGHTSNRNFSSKGKGEVEHGAQGGNSEVGRAYYGSKGKMGTEKGYTNRAQGGKGYKGKGKGHVTIDVNVLP